MSAPVPTGLPAEIPVYCVAASTDEVPVALRGQRLEAVLELASIRVRYTSPDNNVRANTLSR